MITGQWGKPSEVLLDIVVDPDGAVRGIVNPGRQDAPVRQGRFNEGNSTVQLEGEVTRPDGQATPFRIAGRLDGRTLRLSYAFGDDRGTMELVRVEEYRPPRLTLADRLRARLADIRRHLDAHSRPRAEANAKRLRERGESLDSISVRDAVAADIPALAELHVTTWNATYRTSRGPSVSTRVRQWTEVFAKHPRLDFVVVLEDRNGRLIGFAAGKPHYGEFAGQLSKIYVRWEYHGLGLGRRLMTETARRFLDRGIESFILFAERSNPTIGFYDRMGGERLVDERGLFTGAYAWRDVRSLIRDSNG
jgi:ribosomal protein S18 acetylase RimI-like enzyme